MSWYHPSTLLDKIFEAGLLIKGISGALEFLSGFVLLFVNPDWLQRFVRTITAHELVEDHHDKLAHMMLSWAHHFTNGMRVFLIVYLWVHATIKLVAVIGILRNHLWAYPFSLVTLGLLMAYQVYEIIVRTSLGMIALTLFDVFILWLIWREYGKVRSSLGTVAPPEE